MRFLGIIPARGGSKRLPGKNIKPLGGIPLIAWTIRTARESGICVDLIVSTDDAEIAAVSQHYGAAVPSLRPAFLATDTASSMDVVLHVLNEYEEDHGDVNGVVLLQPTSPFRTASTIRQGAELFEKHKGVRSVVSLSPVESHPAWCFHIVGEDNNIRPLMGWEGTRKRSQDLDSLYALNGGLYIASPAQLRKQEGFINEESLAVIASDWVESIDIDTELDWLLAEAVLRV